MKDIPPVSRRRFLRDTIATSNPTPRQDRPPECPGGTDREIRNARDRHERLPIQYDRLVRPVAVCLEGDLVLQPEQGSDLAALSTDKARVTTLHPTVDLQLERRLVLADGLQDEATLVVGDHVRPNRRVGLELFDVCDLPDLAGIGRRRQWAARLFAGIDVSHHGQAANRHRDHGQFQRNAPATRAVGLISPGSAVTRFGEPHQLSVQELLRLEQSKTLY